MVDTAYCIHPFDNCRIEVQVMIDSLAGKHEALSMAYLLIGTTVPIAVFIIAWRLIVEYFRHGSNV